jgi:Leucine Rich repeat
MYSPRGRYQFLCKSTGQPLEYINLDPSCTIENKLLCSKHVQDHSKNSNIMKLDAFLAESRKIFVKDNYDDIDLIRKELRNSGDACKAKIDNYRLLYIETFLQLCQKVDKSVESIVSSIVKVAKEDYLERISLFENPLPSYDPHSLIYGILKGLYITTNDSNVKMEVKMSTDVKKQLNNIKKSTSQFLSQFDDIFILLDRNLTAFKDQRFPELSFSGDSSSKDKEHVVSNGYLVNTSSDKPHNTTMDGLKRIRMSTPSNGNSPPFNRGRDQRQTGTSYQSKGDLIEAKSDDSMQDIFEKILNLPQIPKKAISDKALYDFDLKKAADIANLKDIKNIRSLAVNMSGHQVASDTFTTLSEVLKGQNGLDSLRLDLSNNSGFFTRDSLRELVAGVTQLPNLKKLFINFRINDIADLEMAVLSTMLKLNSLQELEILLSFNVIGDEGLKSFGKGLAQLKSLKRLKIDIQKIKVGSIGFQGLFDGISQLQDLESLILVMSDNSMPDEDMGGLGKALRGSDKLRFLDMHISHNDVKDKGMSTFANCMAQGMKGLREIGLDIQFNGVGYIGLKAFVKAIEERNELERVAINFMDNQSIANVRLNEMKKQLQAIEHSQIKYKI